MSKIIEIMGYPTSQNKNDWTKIIKKQQCPFIGKKCIKTRKDNSNVAIGTCSVKYGKEENSEQTLSISGTRLLD